MTVEEKRRLWGVGLARAVPEGQFLPRGLGWLRDHRTLSEAMRFCEVCGKPLERRLIEAWRRRHGGCESPEAG